LSWVHVFEFAQEIVGQGTSVFSARLSMSIACRHDVQPVQGRDVCRILILPRLVVSRTKRLGVVHRRRDEHLATRADVEAQAGIGTAVLAHDEHDRPLALSEDPFKRLFINRTGLR